MNIKIVENLKNNQVKLTIKLKKRTLVKHSTVMVGWHKVQEIVQKRYKCPDTHILGECLNRHQKMDNNYDHLLEKTWIFNLIPKQPVTTPSPDPVPDPVPTVVTKKVFTQKTSAKRKKKTTVKK